MSSRSTKTWVIVFVLAIIVFIPMRCYMGASVAGKVIDADTQKPIAGVTVLAHWEVETGGYADEHGCVWQMAIEEAVTDDDGRFRLPSWGPRFSGCLLFPGFSPGRSPRIFLFKSGYKLQILENGYPSPDGSSFVGMIRHSIWDGQTTPMATFSGTPKEYARHLTLLTLYLSLMIESSRNGRALLETMPLMLKALNDQRRDFELKNIRSFNLPDADAGLGNK
ncbi:MAG: carboxypeptidase regulatory-like domain-containing protein [Nevskia sp.]|nr:carboxypeptidase regulatory-like domain-containing protein [Nevskia sp.]